MLTNPDLEIGVRNVIDSILSKTKIHRNEIKMIFLRTTIAINAVLECKNLYKVGLIRLMGHFPDTIPPICGWPQKLSDYIFGGYSIINGGHECDGKEITPLNKHEVISAISKMVDLGCEALAVVAPFSNLYPIHETEVADIIKERLGQDFPITLSHQIGGLGIIERENTAILNSALKKSFRLGFDKIANTLSDFSCPFYIVQNNGTILTLQEALEFPIKTICSGSTNSFIGASKLAKVKDAIVIDIGGTSSDAGIIKNYFPLSTFRNIEVGGVRLNLPAPNNYSIAIGGGSIITTDAQKSRIGPNSVGINLFKDSVAFGGNVATVTDIAISLGLIDEWCHKIKAYGKHEAERLMAQLIGEIDNLAERISIKQNLPIILVGGGSSLFIHHKLSSNYIIPAHAAVANAYGAALAEISSTIDKTVNLSNREEVIQELEETAISSALSKGAINPRIIEKNIIPYSYTSQPLARIIITAAGALS